ncbi:MAG: hypothetical protein NDJ89_14760 [Oligoflexia bacterium]|nr:hypothetical protein [Oligoflexia bacterium]
MLFPPGLSAKAIPPLVFALLASTASAAMPEQDYRRALSIAQKKVERTRSAPVQPAARASAPASSASEALSSAIVLERLGRLYRPGESWLVAATHLSPTAMRMTDDPRTLDPGKGLSGVFRYEVLEVKTAPAVEITVRITQLAAYGLAPVDPRIASLELTFSGATQQTRKAYRAVGRAEPIEVAPEALRAHTSILEFFPLDVPEIATAEAQRRDSFPSLPETLAGIRASAGAPPSPGPGIWYEQDDFFGRPIQALWRKGDPWPAYLKTPGGVAILLDGPGGNGGGSS